MPRCIRIVTRLRAQSHGMHMTCNILLAGDLDAFRATEGSCAQTPACNQLIMSSNAAGPSTNKCKCGNSTRLLNMGKVIQIPQKYTAMRHCKPKPCWAFAWSRQWLRPRDSGRLAWLKHH